MRVFDPDAAAGQSCQWSFAGAVPANAADPRQFVTGTQRALHAAPTTVLGDCRELRLVVPSDPSDPRSVAGQATVTRKLPDGSQTSVTVAPRDRLVIGFGDSFTSGEGNPERLAVFSGAPWTGGNLPARDPDPVSLKAKDTRAQWTDRWCHRSVYSWQIRTALDAALADPRQSFTILPYGCSGATITEGILYGYNGVEWSAQTDKGVVGSRSEIGLAYQEICRPPAFRSYCASGASWCGQTDPPTARQEQTTGFYDAAAPALRRAVARCGPNNVFKRSADALLIDIGINDVGFAGWAASIILQDPALRAAAGATAPCFDGTARCASTQSVFARLDRRYGLLRTVLDQYMLPDFGIDPSHVIVAVYPPALQNEEGAFCPQGNSGLTIATFPPPPLPLPFANSCSGSALPVATGVLAEYPASDQVERDVEHARVKLNEALAAFALRPPTEFDLVTAYTSDYGRRGVCATTYGQSRPPAGQACFTTLDLFNLRCAPEADIAESMHAPRAGPLSSACSGDPAAFLPFPPGRFEPYRSRTRTLPHHERRLSCDQSEASVLPRSKSLRRARPFWPRDRRCLPSDRGRSRGHRELDDRGTLPAPRLRSVTRERGGKRVESPLSPVCPTITALCAKRTARWSFLIATVRRRSWEDSLSLVRAAKGGHNISLRSPRTCVESMTK